MVGPSQSGVHSSIVLQGDTRFLNLFSCPLMAVLLHMLRRGKDRTWIIHEPHTRKEFYHVTTPGADPDSSL